MAMTVQVGTEDFVLQKKLPGAKVEKALKAVLEDTFGTTDMESLRSDIASELDIEEEDLPENISVTLTVKFGTSSVSVSGTETETEDTESLI